MKDRLSRLLAVVTVLLGGCAGPASSTGPASPAPSKPASTSNASAGPGELLFAVLEARGRGAQMGAQPGVADAHDRVAIVGLDGYARAKADFTPRTVPTVGNAAALLQPEARVANGRVFYVDGTGVVNELTRSGSRPVATFSLMAQQAISFAVSPDGTQLEAGRFTFPPLNPNRTDITNLFLSDKSRYELLAATAGGPTRTIVDKQTSGGVAADEPEPIGWDPSGPVAIEQPTLGTQQESLGRVVFGRAVHLDPSGRAGPVIGGPDCDFVGSGGSSVLCVDSQFVNYSVRTTSGSTIWSLPAAPQGQYYSYVRLSPDASQIAYRGSVRGRNGTSVPLPGNFNPEGWLDNQTLIGILGESNQQEMAIIHLGSPSKVDDLGFKGEFVGVVAGG